MAEEVLNPLDQLKKIPWYHEDADRQTAESVLLVSNQEGTYLMRPSRTKVGEMAISIRCKASVKHVSLVYKDAQFKFGLGSFNSVEELLRHFTNQPLVAGESGVMTRLRYPLPRQRSGPSNYETIRIQGELGQTPSMRVKKKGDTLPVVTKEGYLTKIGDIRKSWKRRWFVLNHVHFKYYQDHMAISPKRSLDLRECTHCGWDNSHGKENCFRLVFPTRTFFMFAERRSEAEGWVTILLWVLNHLEEAAKENGHTDQKRGFFLV